jgi:hypothetical protein
MKKPNPIIVADAGWADSIPDWLRQEIEAERMLSALSDLSGRGENPEEVGDAECAAYLMTASLATPMSGEWARIYQYLCTGLMKKSRDTAVPEDIAVHDLSEDEQRLLKDLRSRLFKKRGGKVRNELTDTMEQAFPDRGKRKESSRRRRRSHKPV